METQFLQKKRKPNRVTAYIPKSQRQVAKHFMATTDLEVRRVLVDAAANQTEVRADDRGI